MNHQLERFSGNLVCSNALAAQKRFNLVSVHCPAWPLERDLLGDPDLEAIRLNQNPDLWLTEILWAGIQERSADAPWIVGGDFNSSDTFDHIWGPTPRGNREFLDRMEEVGFTEVLRYDRGRLTPTFQNAMNKEVIHQIDHLFVSHDMIESLATCGVGASGEVFAQNLSDHLPIIADFDV